MNKIIFFWDSHLVRRGGVVDFLLNQCSEAWLSNNKGTKKIQSLVDILYEPEYWHRESWYISGSYTEGDNQELAVGSLFQKEPKFTATLEDINAKISSFSRGRKWVLFPWGGMHPFSAFGFLSADGDILEGVTSLYIHTDKSCSLISSYAFDSLNFTRSIRSILMGGYHVSAYPLWNIKGDDSKTLWMATDLVISDDFSVFDWWVPSGYELVEHLPAETSAQKGLNIYEISTEDSFRAMCYLSSQEPRTLVFLPSDTNSISLRRLLRKTESYSSSSDLISSDLISLEDILRDSEWFLGLDRDRIDYGYSFLVARDNKLLHRFSAASQSYDFRLIACF
ncbi:hypothetical protein [cf. Phormidesmis sp. LEGE 11477]|uniref:hypothetical protein n=1 Tax=cf. Phormidesmis sp. LEGE 11477 TaxID=1828680 RepID=UPI00187E41A4|nr:hypothetical protein [cf. Phormidesmis sp. LEGE 11477]MBE9061401.1 hypothetical protein [cf. Phormidesmis sp. LEGE 11477]